MYPHFFVHGDRVLSHDFQDTAFAFVSQKLWLWERWRMSGGKKWSPCSSSSANDSPSWDGGRGEGEAGRGVTYLDITVSARAVDTLEALGRALVTLVTLADSFESAQISDERSVRVLSTLSTLSPCQSRTSRLNSIPTLVPRTTNSPELWRVNLAKVVLVQEIGDYNQLRLKLLTLTWTTANSETQRLQYDIRLIP